MYENVARIDLHMNIIVPTQVAAIAVQTPVIGQVIVCSLAASLHLEPFAQTTVAVPVGKRVSVGATPVWKACFDPSRVVGSPQSRPATHHTHYFSILLLIHHFHTTLI